MRMWSMWIRMIFLVSLVSVVACVAVQDLSGSDWLVSSATNGAIYRHIPSTVPGSIYSDLQKANIIDKELYANFNDVDLRWVAYHDWTFEKHFDVNPNVLAHSSIFLTCHGLDTVGDVYLNGHHLGNVNNMFIRYKWSVSSLLKPKQNTIQVRFVSAPKFAQKYYLDTLNTSYIIAPVCNPKEYHGECHFNFLRKMQSSFAWDWGPAFPTQGIWKAIILEAQDLFTLRSITVNTAQDHTDTWFLNVTLWLESLNNLNMNGNVTLNLNNRELYMHQFNVKFDPNGEAFIPMQIMVPHGSVQAWFPNGMGKQPLYYLTATVQIAHEVVSKSVNIGFRTIELVQDRVNSSIEAYTFYFRVNGIPFFAKGSNWIPAHALHEAISENYLEELLLAAKMANMNMLRVWGGGIYEDDKFYQLADKYGILIWQDMMFACALYPTDHNFLQSVSTEIRQQIRRLQHHPSIALWAGNNENEAAIAQFWWPEVFTNLVHYKQDYLKLYVNTIKPIVEKEDPSRPFLTSSPSNGIVSARENYISSNPQDNRFGDVHWYINDGNAWDWQRYPSSKFVSEYGFQSLPSLSTLRNYLTVDLLKYPFNRGMTHREHKPSGLSYLMNFIKENLPLPKSVQNGSTEALDNFIYLSQVHQSMAIKIETEFYRRNRQVDALGEGFTMGALYWQLNQIWPAFSWSSIEYGGKWKMLHYYVRKMFDNLLIDVYEENGSVNVMIIRDDHLQKRMDFDVDIAVYDWSQTQPLLIRRTKCFVEPFSVKLAHSENISNLLKNAHCVSRQNCFIQVSAQTNFEGKMLKRQNFLLIDKIKNAIGLEKTNIKVADIAGPVKQSEMFMFHIRLESDRIAPFVWIDVTNHSGIFSDNGFLLINSTTIQFSTKYTISKSNLLNSLVIKSLKDVRS